MFTNIFEGLVPNMNKPQNDPSVSVTGKADWDGPDVSGSKIHGLLSPFQTSSPRAG